MRILVHIGPEQVGAAALQRVLADKRDQLAGKGVLYARAPGNRNHTKLFMAVTDPDHVDPLRHAACLPFTRRMAGRREGFPA